MLRFSCGIIVGFLSGVMIVIGCQDGSAPINQDLGSLVTATGEPIQVISSTEIPLPDGQAGYHYLIVSGLRGNKINKVVISSINYAPGKYVKIKAGNKEISELPLTRLAEE